MSAGRAGRLPVSAELDPFRPALGRLVPEWRQPQAAADESLVYLGEAVLRLLRVLSPDTGCLLVLEDLHWADRETLALLEYLADNLSAERVPCTGTLRDEEGGEAAALAAALEARGSAAVLPLARLDPAAMARMAAACVGAAELPGTIQSFVAEQAEGIPFLVEEVLAGLIGEGALTERDGSWHAADLVTAAVPATFADAVRRRLDAVDADSRHVLGAAAVLGRRFDWALLGPVTGMTDAAVVAALRRGVGLQLVAADRESFRFRHALTHEAVLAALLPPERALLAGRALAAVEAAHPGVPGAWCMLAADLAEHAGDTARAGALLLEAGRRDLAVGALASAEHTLARAQALAGPGDAGLRRPVDGAVLWDIYAELKDADYRLAGAQAMERLLARSGISQDSTVVFCGYGPAMGFWLMKLYGHADVRILNCSRDAWRSGGRRWSSQESGPAATSYPLHAQNGQLRAGHTEVASAIGDPATTSVDVRSEEEYRGERFWPSGGLEPGGRAGPRPLRGPPAHRLALRRARVVPRRRRPPRHLLRRRPRRRR